MIKSPLNKRKIIVAGLLTAFLTACATSAFSTENRIVQLVISQFPVERELGHYSLGPGKTFSLSFIHSVSNTRVTDVYEIQAGKIIQTRELFKTHGAGLPSSPEEPGGLFWEKNGDGFILHMRRAIPKLVVRTNKIYQNRLVLGPEIIDLNQWEDQALLLNVRQRAPLLEGGAATPVE